MKGYSKRKAIKGQKGSRVTIAVDAVTNAAVKALMEREGLSYSAGICALATASAIKDPGLMAAIKVVVRDSVRDSLAASGFHPGFSRELARELTTGHKRPHPDYPMPGLDEADNLRAGVKEPTDGHI